jgi:hypothetical protein
MRVGEENMLKIKIETEFDLEQMTDIFNSMSVKFTKKKLAELKRQIKENPEWIRDEIEKDIEIALQHIIGDLFEEDLK